MFDEGYLHIFIIIQASKDTRLISYASVMILDKKLGVVKGKIGQGT